jgi:hypothetical protein
MAGAGRGGRVILGTPAMAGVGVQCEHATQIHLELRHSRNEKQNYIIIQINYMLKARSYYICLMSRNEIPM